MKLHCLILDNASRVVMKPGGGPLDDSLKKFHPNMQAFKRVLDFVTDGKLVELKGLSNLILLKSFSLCNLILLNDFKNVQNVV